MDNNHRPKTNIWSKLHPEILRSIAELLRNNPPDLLSFQLVCKQWHNSTSLQTILPLKFSPHSNLYSSSVFLLNPNSTFSSFASPPPWLLSCVEFSKGNPNFHQIFNNSSFETLPVKFDLNLFQPRLLDVAYHLDYESDEESYSFDKMLVFPTDFVPSIEECAVVGIRNGGKLCGYPPLRGLDNEDLVEACKVDISHGSVTKFDDVIKLKGMILAVDRQGKVYEIDGYTLEIVRVYVGSSVCADSNKRWRKRLFRTPAGSLYLIVRQNETIKKRKRGKGQSQGFKVYILSNSDEVRFWVEVKSLGNRVLFVSRDFGFFVGEDELLPGCNLRNCMVFSYDGFPRYAKNCWVFDDGGKSEDNVGVFRFDGEGDDFQLVESYPGLSMVLGSPPPWALQPPTSPPSQSPSPRHIDGEDTISNSEESQETNNFSHNTSAKEKSRGPTRMKNIPQLCAKVGGKIKVEFSSNGEALGDNGSTYRSYLGVLARSNIPITLKNWKRVPAKTKNDIWNDLKNFFEGIEHRKDEEMKVAGTLWRNFKSKLTSKYITGKAVKEGENPLKKYPFITEEIWKEFVARRQTKEFLATSEEQRRRQAYNVCPHTMSRGGYRKLEEKLKKEKLEELKSSSLTEDIPPSSIDIPHHVKWKKGRINKEGKYVTSMCESVAEKIDEFDDQSCQGSFVPSGKNDILTAALGTDEHPGRVRAVGGNVGLTKVFGRSSKGPTFSKEEMMAVKSEMMSLKHEMLTVKSEMMAMKNQMGLQEPQDFMSNEQQKSIEEEIHISTHQSAENSSPIQSDPFVDIPQGGLKCLLMLEKSEKRDAVAVGKVYHVSDGLLHGKSLPKNHMKVSIEIPLDENADVPVPTCKVRKVIQAIGAFLAWPKNLIEFNIEACDDASEERCMESKKGENNKTKESNNQPNLIEDIPNVIPSLLPRGCKPLYGLARRMNNSSPVLIPIEKHVMQIAYDLHVSKANVFQFLTMAMVKTNCMELYMKYLYHVCHDKGISNLFGFICPSMTRYPANFKEKTQYMDKCLVEGKKQCFLAPYIDGKRNHWMLGAIYPHENQVFWLDPLGYSPPKGFRDMVESGLRSFQGKGIPKKQGAKSNWIKVNCPRQLGAIECGYYVMTYMRDIINGRDHNDPRECFEGEMSYIQDELDETRCEWATFFMECESEMPSYD